MMETTVRQKRRDGSAQNGAPPRPPSPPKPPVAEKPRKPRLRKLRFALVFLGLSLLAFVSWIFGIMMAVAQDLPALENRAQYERAENSIVYDATGKKLATLTNNEGRILLPSDEIAASMKSAVVAIEDQRFYDHRGVDFQGIARAVVQDILAQSAQQGASTITQQFVKNALTAQEDRTIFQKLREAALAYHLERQWSKDKILTEYLNSIYFGEGAYGIEAAARTYFGYKHPGCGEGDDALSCASQLLPYESALLAGLISSPAAYSPRANPESAVARRNLVLQRMVETGAITQAEYETYSVQDIPDADDISPPAENSEAPYFTSWLRQQLVDKYGAGEAFGGGLEITSSLDLDLQRQVESIASSTLSGIEPTASIVVLDNDTGTVRAMVGGPDYSEAPFNLATNGHRQPGSAFKPFTLIAALQQGHSSSEVYASSPQTIPFRARFEKNGETKTVPELFEPKNYEDNYLGSASIATATTYSDNSVYAQLGTQVGPANVAATAADMGIETDLSTDVEYSIDGGPFEPYNPALILGGLTEGVTPLEMAHAYETIAAGGKRISGTMAAGSGDPVGIIEVRDRGEDEVPGNRDGELVKDNDGNSGQNKVIAKQVVDPAVAAEAKTLLTSVVTSGTGENAQTAEVTWGKTGTTDDNGDAWFVGSTDELTIAVWVGHADSNTPMETEFGGQPVDGGTYPALIFSRIVDAWEGLQDDRQAGREVEEPPTSSETDSTTPVPDTTTPAPDTGGDSGGGEGAPATGAGDAAGGGGSVAPTGGGVAAG
jgi:penicillin-binding protein 1A